MSSIAGGNYYWDVFVFEDLVYALERWFHVVHVYRNHNNSLIKLHDFRYPCGCNVRFPCHSIIVTNEHIIQCCTAGNIVSILNRSGELLRHIPIADISKLQPILCQVDIDGNFLIADRFANHLLIAHLNQPCSQWRVVNFRDSSHLLGCVGAVWFRHKLHAASRQGRLTTFAPVDTQSP